ncbi:MAG: intradiol ring-cleavage dioxygenase [Gammaproteobacteria bacterium]|nr:intradiol ring-cleavage dioxygenase [Gammaproteobacteria bacterium]
MSDVDKSRRKAMVLMASSLAAAAVPLSTAAAKLAPTPAQAEGPFYPVVDFSGIGNDLITAADGSKANGRPLALSGAILATGGQPVAGAVVEIWQADNNGNYRHPRDREDEVDPAFKGFGATRADADGRYDFLTIVPVPYTGRPPHIHVKIKAGGETLLTTQLYLQGDARNDRDILLRGLSETAAESLMIEPRAADENNVYRASADIVVVV